ncbi:MAG: hypothetical protein F9B45_22565 [Phycisphaera sp. RhM]|nr:hypothetical protein [Phycisphaera sp. RhM]
MDLSNGETARLPVMLGVSTYSKCPMTKSNRIRRRRGAVAVLVAVLLVVVLGMVACAVDLGVLMVAQSDLQRAADAAAHAAVLEYRSDGNAYRIITDTRRTAKQYVEDNPVLDRKVTVHRNTFNADLDGDIVVGRIDFSNPRGPMTYDDPEQYNAVRVKVSQTADRNGEVGLFFANVLGYSSMMLRAEATAAIIKNVGGFKVPGSGDNVPFLPITIDEDYWEHQVRKGADDWGYDAVSQSIDATPDGIPEVVLFPTRTSSSGNFGTVNIGQSSNSTKHLAGQIRDGLSKSDLDYHGGSLALGDSGELILDGDPGLSASVKDDLESIAGKPVIIPIYRDVSGNGNNAKFVIVKFVGVRIVAVNLTGGNKYVSVQPANVTFKGVVQAAPGVSGTSQDIYSPPVIVQ